MDIEKLDKYLRGKKGVTVRTFGGAKRYLLCDRMFARISYDKLSRAVLSVRAQPGRLEYFREEFGGAFFPCKDLEPLHWNSVLIENATTDDAIMSAVDESYEIFFSDLSVFTKKFFDDNEPSYRYIWEKFDLPKITATDAKGE